MSDKTLLRLPRTSGNIEWYELGEPSPYLPPEQPATGRIAYAAAHVVRDPLANGNGDPAGPARLDWEKTLEFRRHLWSYGMGIAEAMDTAQRGMGLDWAATRELITRSSAEAAACGGAIACGAGTDQLVLDDRLGIDDVIAAYEEQCAFIEAAGSPVILMASRAMAKVAKGPEDYLHVYNHILSQVTRPVILHWLGDMFDPALAGYWGSTAFESAADVVMDIIHTNPGKVDGVKISLLDAGYEISLRRRLPAGVHMYTGDDFNYADLIKGDEQGHSEALLGIFDLIAPAAATAFVALDAGDTDRYDEIMDPTLPLSRHIFQTPTYNYKTGLVFMAWLNGFQDHFQMVGGMESSRSVTHLGELMILADQAKLIRDPELAASRMRKLLAIAGLE